jgi:hypothetical protein
MGFTGSDSAAGRILLLQAPAGDVDALGRALFVAAVIQLPHREVTHALVKQARRHGMLGQLHHAVMQHHGGAAWPHASRVYRILGARRAGGRSHPGVGVGGFHFDIFRVRRNALDVRTARVHGGGVEPLARAQLEHIAGEQAGNFDDDGRLAAGLFVLFNLRSRGLGGSFLAAGRFRRAVFGRGSFFGRLLVFGRLFLSLRVFFIFVFIFALAGLLAERGNRKTHDDGVVVGGLHGQRDGRFWIRHHFVIHFPEIDFVCIALPADHPLGHKLAAVPDALSGARNLRHEKKFPVQLGLGNLVVVLILDLMHGEQAGFRLGVFGDHLVIGLRLPRRAGGEAAHCADLSAGWEFSRGGRRLLRSQKEKRNQENENATGGCEHGALLGDELHYTTANPPV